MELNYPLTSQILYQCVRHTLSTAYGVAHHDELVAILAQLEPAEPPDLSWEGE